MTDQNAKMVCALIVAAGYGMRIGDRMSPPKQYLQILDLSVLGHSITCFTQSSHIDLVQVVIAPEHIDMYHYAISQLDQSDADQLLEPVMGGATRQSSVANGLAALRSSEPDYVLIHDAARPFVHADTINQIINALKTHDGVLPVIPMTDTIKRISKNRVISTEDRLSLAAAQTPQGFKFAKIDVAHLDALNESDTEFTDDSMIAELADMDVAAVEGDPLNIKITTKDDLETARLRMIESNHPASVLTAIPRVGSGFDVHAFAPDDPLEQINHVRLCGVDIPYTRQLSGHSDADVVLHAIADALYGAVAAGDIGTHFPPSDDKWKGANSGLFVTHALEIVRSAGATLVHIDVTIICERPQIGPHRNAMRTRLMKLLKLSAHDVSIKATTTERLGFLGREEGIAAQALASVTVVSASRILKSEDKK